jgi:hypothetical protein
MSDGSHISGGGRIVEPKILSEVLYKTENFAKVPSKIARIVGVKWNI